MGDSGSGGGSAGDAGKAARELRWPAGAGPSVGGGSRRGKKKLEWMAGGAAVRGRAVQQRQLPAGVEGRRTGAGRQDEEDGVRGGVFFCN